MLEGRKLLHLPSNSALLYIYKKKSLQFHVFPGPFKAGDLRAVFLLSFCLVTAIILTLVRYEYSGRSA